MTFTVLDRVLIGNILPEKGSLADILIVKDIKSRMELSKEERKDINFRTTDDNTGLVWDKELDLKITLSDAEKNLILDTFKKLDEEKNLTIQLAEIYIKIKGM